MSAERRDFDRDSWERRWSQALSAGGHAVDDAVAALAPEHWEILVAEDRPREVAGSEVDAVVRARRRG